MRVLRYSGTAIRWAVVPEFDGHTVTVPDFSVTVMGNDYPMTGGSFVLENEGDTVYVTPSGLVQENADSPGEKAVFPETGACYWLLSRVSDDILKLEAGA